MKPTHSSTVRPGLRTLSPLLSTSWIRRRHSANKSTSSLVIHSSPMMFCSIDSRTACASARISACMGIPLYQVMFQRAQ
jgi:hypothetical protein